MEPQFLWLKIKKLIEEGREVDWKCLEKRYGKSTGICLLALRDAGLIHINFRGEIKIKEDKKDSQLVPAGRI